MTELDFIKRATALRDELSDALSGFGGYLRCRTCGHSEDLGDPGRRVTGEGWPQCCGYTMEWITQRQIDDGERPARGAPTTQEEKDGK